MEDEGEPNWWRRCTFIVALLSVLLLSGPSAVSAEGNVGCHFVKSLCLEEIETCYDDLVFGKCLGKAGIDQDDIERKPLTEEQSRIMATMLEEMQGAGLGWDHAFVQCRIQGTLFSMRRNTPLPPNLCANLAPDPDILGPQSPLAFVRFTPPNNDYADEVYYPPLKKGFDDRIFPQSVKISEDSPYMKERKSEFIVPRPQLELFEQETLPADVISNRVKDIKNRIELRRMLAEYELGKLNPPVYANDEVYLENDLPDEYTNHFKENYKRTGEDLSRQSKLEEEEDNLQLPKAFVRKMAKAENFPMNYDEPHYSHDERRPLEVILPVRRESDLEEAEEEFRNNYYPVRGHKNKSPHRKIPPDAAGVYTEGGLVYVPERSEPGSLDRKEEARNMLADMLGFTRHERLDVKKPGPLMGPPPSASSAKDKEGKGKPKGTSETKEVIPVDIKTDDGPKIKKLMAREHSDEDHGSHSVDTEYAHVMLKQPLDNWSTGERIVFALADILHMQGYFTHPRVDRHEVTFRVEDNPEKKTAADIAKSINDIRTKTNISRRLGITVLRAGVGDKIKSDPESMSAPRIELADDEQDLTHIIAYMFAGAGAAAIVVILVILFLISRHDRKKDKLSGLQGGLTGAESCSKDYQELCRARMSGKGTSPPEAISSGRITSLSKENDRPPSSRSSTSSWSEEPALTNMDISTGHMVLSYMEDHLRNKGRLQREWEALCRYEAEPSARETALQTQCAPLNRPGAPLPYDHSRVVLNHLANAEGLDYINASTITDHDPRAPAYIAAQGPLPTTLAHFWQMIWEQGAVVIVALCRLQENGEVACARYWPEEGAEVYHIYEVHLVSEHIWCDDYLVRSFYLKNLRTSETRTVTQFHFLSWPHGGVPSQAKALLEFRRKVNKSYRGRSCPIVVHGSTGAGRTGAYILLDLVLGRMNKGAREIDIAATLEHLRDQRAGLVATKQQFEFVLMAVAEEVHAILKALPANQGEKRELDKESLKEEDAQAEKQVKTEDVAEKTKEKQEDK